MPHPALIALAAVLAAAAGSLCAGTATAHTPLAKASTVETTAICPPGSQIDPQNSQQCQSLSPAGADTSTSGCRSAGYSIDARASGYYVDSTGHDTLGSQQ
jgi:hypothetical protein